MCLPSVIVRPLKHTAYKQTNAGSSKGVRALHFYRQEGLVDPRLYYAVSRTCLYCSDRPMSLLHPSRPPLTEAVSSCHERANELSRASDLQNVCGLGISKDTFSETSKKLANPRKEVKIR